MHDVKPGFEKKTIDFINYFELRSTASHDFVRQLYFYQAHRRSWHFVSGNGH